jgi:MFS family permease
MLLAGLGIGALASQLGAVTVSSVPDEETGEVGGLQNTVTNLGASIGTAVAGAVLITILTSSFLSGLANNPDVPDRAATNASTELASGIPFVSDADLQQELEKADVPTKTAEAVVEENEEARLEGLRAALAVLALLGLLALFTSRSIPEQQPGEPAAA